MIFALYSNSMFKANHIDIEKYSALTHEYGVEILHPSGIDGSVWITLVLCSTPVINLLMKCFLTQTGRI